jgi:CYTH domain-containing protein
MPSASSKYARIEVERRFLLAGVPVGAEIAAVHEIDDRYVDGTRLRLRRMAETGGATQLKLTQKLPEDDGGALRGHLTTIYVSEAEHAVLARLPAATLSKTRLSIPPYGVDVFHGPLAGLFLAEVEFATVEEAEAHAPAPFCGPEVTTDPRFTGGELVRASGEQVRAWAREYGVDVRT